MKKLSIVALIGLVLAAVFIVQSRRPKPTLPTKPKVPTKPTVATEPTLEPKPTLVPV